MPSGFEVTARPFQINWDPLDEIEEVTQNVQSILGDPAGSVPLARGMGISADLVDAPMSKARAMLMTAAYRSIQQDEPRARVTAVFVDAVDGNTGQITPRVKVEI